ncbi:hypothetical protein [Streptomyces ossamyceticus]|uniref:hypothetical protein n=1 Tax=Streptomyces ossamyceticus TaxID=249581 RepID=UPI0012FF0E0A|nr:hypothetical protein [Streptomyces ossamyceticus]
MDGEMDGEMVEIGRGAGRDIGRESVGVSAGEISWCSGDLCLIVMVTSVGTCALMCSVLFGELDVVMA